MIAQRTPWAARSGSGPWSLLSETIGIWRQPLEKASKHGLRVAAAGECTRGAEGGGGIEVRNFPQLRNFSQFPANSCNFPQFFRNWIGPSLTAIPPLPCEASSLNGAAPTPKFGVRRQSRSVGRRLASRLRPHTHCQSLPRPVRAPPPAALHSRPRVRLPPAVTQVIFQLVGLRRAVATGLTFTLTAPFVFATTPVTVNVTVIDGWGGVAAFPAGSIDILPATEAVFLQEAERLRGSPSLSSEDVVVYSEVCLCALRPLDHAWAVVAVVGGVAFPIAAADSRSCVWVGG